MSEQKQQVCIRCRGAKKMYRIGGSYTRVDNGSRPVTCPLCKGIGFMPSIDECIKAVAEDEQQQIDVKKKKRPGRPKKADVELEASI